jgi:hypothetical protein
MRHALLTFSPLWVPESLVRYDTVTIGVGHLLASRTSKSANKGDQEYSSVGAITITISMHIHILFEYCTVYESLEQK